VIGIGHAVCPENARIVKTVLNEKLPDNERVFMADLGTALGVHGGAGTLIISTQPYVNPASLAE
jgi:hypothetical protein